MEWQSLKSQVPVINIIQHVRHANPSDRRYQFLPRKAVRICVSQEISALVEETGRANGPIYTVPIGLDSSALPLPKPYGERDIPILIAGMKNPAIAQEIALSLSQLGIDHELLISFLPRAVFLDKLARARIAVILPMAIGEGFFTVPLEAMALGALVVSADVPGNRISCIDGVNSFRPSYSAEEILQAILRADSLSDAEAEGFKQAGLKMVADHNIAQERLRFLEILENLEQIW